MPPNVRTVGFEVVAIDSIEPHPRNVNEGDRGAITETMDALGFFGAVLVQQSTRRIIAGKHRWQVARERGMDEIPVLWTDYDDDEAVRVMLADNATARKGRDDQVALAELLQELHTATERGLGGTGHTGDDLDRIIADVNSDADLVLGEPSVAPHRAQPAACPRCGYPDDTRD